MNILGGPGTVSGLVLRIWRCLFAGAALYCIISVPGSHHFSTYRFLSAAMVVQMMSSLGLMYYDLICLRSQRSHHNPMLLTLFVIIDWAVMLLTLAVASSSLAVTVFMFRYTEMCWYLDRRSCSMYNGSTLLALVAWLLNAISALAVFWLRASM